MRATRGLVALPLLALLLFPMTVPVQAGHSYQQPVWFTWNTTELDVLVLVPDDPLIGAATERSIDNWVVGIQEFEPSFNLKVRVFWPAKGDIPPADFRSDIAVLPQGFFATQGTPSSTAFGIPKCYAFAPMAAGWGPFYRVIAHEFGHCLGLGHVFNHGVEYSPGFDIMGSGGQSNACPSNLNVLVLERVFAGQGGTVSVTSQAYRQADC